MEPIRPSRGKARGRPQFPTIQPGVSGLSNLPPRGIQQPVMGTMIWPFHGMPPPTGISQQRAPRPLLPRPGMSTDHLPRPRISGDNTALKQNPMAGVRIY